MGLLSCTPLSGVQLVSRRAGAAALGIATGIALIGFTSFAHAWKFDEKKDAMGRGDTKIAFVESINEVTFDFPYRGAQHGVLLLRAKPNDVDVILRIDRGQFLCGIRGCDLTVRFDDGKPMKWSAGQPADHSSTALFLNRERKFLEAVRKAKIVRIEATFFQAGTRVFEFDSSGLGNWPAATGVGTPKMGKQ